MKNKFNNAENKVLSEIYRRLNFFHGGNLNENLLLLSYPSEAKLLKEYELIKPYSNEIPRVLNWYNLTEKGKTFFSNYVTKRKLSESINTSLFEGSYVKQFDKTLLSDKKELFATAMLLPNDTWHNFTKPFSLSEFDHIEQVNNTTQSNYYYCWFEHQGKEMRTLFVCN